MNIKEQLKNFITEELLEEEGELEDDEKLLVDGMIDSLGMLRLVAFVEETCNIKVPPEHFVIENFRSINALFAYIGSVQGEHES